MGIHIIIFLISRQKHVMAHHLRGGGHFIFGADPIGGGIGIAMTLSCLHNIL